MTKPRRRLSEPQRRMMATLHQQGTLKAPWGLRDSGRHASAFWRTAGSLADRGLVVLNRASVSLPTLTIVG